MGIPQMFSPPSIQSVLPSARFSDALVSFKFFRRPSDHVFVFNRILHTQMVVTSNFTSALDVLSGLADRNGWGYLRLDGGTASNERQSLVDRFNRAPPEKVFLFFLSARAGGVGLNL